MKVTTILSFVALAGSSISAFAVVDDILQNTATFKPKITVSDIYSEKVVVERDDDTIFRSVEANPQRIALSLTANLDGAVTGTIDADTTVAVSASTFSHSDTLGDAVDYKPGGKKATFPYYADVDLPNGDTKTVRVGTIVYAWTAKVLTVTMSITDVEAAESGDIAATDYTDAADPGQKVAIEGDPIEVTVDFGDASGSRNVFLQGQARNVIKTYGAPTSDDYDELNVVDVNIQGAADVTGPAVKAAFPARPNVLNQVDVSGTATDLQELTLDTVTVNNVSAASAVMTLSDPSDAGIYSWSVTGVALRKGANSVVVTFSDADGNQTKVTKAYTIR